MGGQDCGMGGGGSWGGKDLTGCLRKLTPTQGLDGEEKRWRELCQTAKTIVLVSDVQQQG